jgi:hypothetical protein
MYVAYFGILQELANRHGYALCVHGSVVRDFDLIAVPFEARVSPHEVLLGDIRKAIGSPEEGHPAFSHIGHEPHGRTCYTIESGGGGYFDISFTPTLEQAIIEVQRKERRDAEIEVFLKAIRTSEKALKDESNP